MQTISDNFNNPKHFDYNLFQQSFETWARHFKQIKVHFKSFIAPPTERNIFAI